MTLPYTHLTLAERREIYRLRSAQIPVPGIAQRPGLIATGCMMRNCLTQCYFHVAADMQARAR